MTRNRSAEWIATNAARERDIAAHPATLSGGPFDIFPAHRLLHEDGGLHCFVCGAFFANPRGDEFTETTDEDNDYMRVMARAVPCTGPTTEHPGYYTYMLDGEPYRETCAVHPYSDTEGTDAE